MRDGSLMPDWVGCLCGETLGFMSLVLTYEARALTLGPRQFAKAVKQGSVL